MDRKLIVLDGPMRGVEFVLPGNRVYLGTDHHAEVRLPLDDEVAPYHLQLTAEDGEYWLQQLGNAQGALLRGQALHGVERVAPFDLIRVGRTTLCLVDAGVGSLEALERHAGALATAAGDDERTRVLAVDDDVDFLLHVKELLRSHGYAVDTALDGVEALRKLEAARFDVVVSDVRMPNLDGWSLFEKLRSSPAQARVPVIFVTGHEELHARGFQMGADDCLTKSQLKELDLRIRGAIERRTRLDAALQTPPVPTTVGALQGVRGTLDQMSLPALLTFLQMEKKTGRLALRRIDGTATGFIEIRRGDPVRAGVEPQGKAHSEAVYALLGWPDGGFDFVAGPVAEGDEIHSDAMHLLMEAARREDEDGSGDV